MTHKQYTKPRLKLREKIANCATHALACISSLIGAVALLELAQDRSNFDAAAACFVYCVTMVLLYLASSMYHGVQRQPLKAKLRVLDHAGIYLLIAGTYTPFAVSALDGSLSWAPLLLVWGLSFVGIIIAVKQGKRPTLFWSTTLYLTTGWLAGVHALFLWPETMLPLVLGGCCYSVGVPFFVRDHKPYRHTIWHLSVMAGSGCHYWAIMQTLAIGVV